MKRVTSIFTYTGLVLILMTLVVIVAMDLFPTYVRCTEIMQRTSVSDMTYGQIRDMNVNDLLRCNSIQTDIYLGYLFVGLGFAMLIAGFIVSNGQGIDRIRKKLNGAKKKNKKIKKNKKK